MKRETSLDRWNLFKTPRSGKSARRPAFRKTYRPVVEWLETRVAPANVDVLSSHNDLLLSGQNLQEEILTPANVNATSFGKLFSKPVDGYVYAQPLYKANLLIPNQGIHNVAFVATEHDSVYAFDTDNLAAGAGSDGSLWKVSFLAPANGITSVPAGDVGVVSTNIVPEVGITGTPVIDGATNTLYVVAKTKEERADGAHYVQKLHALDLATGQEKFGGPALIGDTLGTSINTSPISVSGNGDGAVNGVVTFNARQELQRPALQLVNGVVYISWASHEDARPYHGWVVGYSASNLAAGPVKVFNTAPNAGGVGIWESGGSLAADAQGNLYFAVGNGFNGPDQAYDPAHGDYSESVLKLSTTGQLTVADYFTPFDWQTLDAQDADLGSGGTMMLPNSVGSAAHPHLMVETGKSGKIYLIDRDNMGKLNNSGTGPDLVVQTVTAGQAGVWGNPSFYQLNATTGIIYYHGQGDFLKGYLISNGHIDDTPADILRSNFRSSYPGTQPVVSANGTLDPANPTNGIVWELQVDAGDPSTNPTGAAILRAFRTTDLSTELYDSNQTSLRDQPTAAVKFTVPTVTNGHVLVAAQYSFSVFGLFPTATALAAARTNLEGSAQATSRGTQIQLSWINPDPSPGATATGIKLLRSPDGSNFTQIATVGAQVSTYTDAGPFITGQHYFYRVIATNQLGDSGPSNTADVVAPIPSAVLTITSVTSSSLGLSWTGVANDHNDIERSTDGVKFTHIATVPAAQLTYTDTGLTPGIYAYRVHAFSTNPASDSLSNVQGATVGPVINHDTGFGTTVDLTANGSARFGNNIVRLTGDDLQTGSFFANTPLTIGQFSTSFIFRLSEGTQPNYADGLAFVVQANAPTALGQGLGGLGYQGIGNSVAVKFGSFQYPGDPSNSSAGLVLNGAPPRGGVTTGNVLLNSQNPKRVMLTYDGATLRETISDTLTGDSFTTSFLVNIPQIIGSNSAYIGFTASTGSPGAGSFWQLQDVGSWTFTSQAPLPGAPTNLRVTSTGATEIDLNWSGNSFNETGFRIERSTDGGTTFTTVGTSTTTTFADTGLAHGTYFYRVRAFNGNGASDPTNVVTATIPAGDPPPAITGVTRSNFAVKPNGTLTLTVTFDDPDPNDPHTAVITWGDNSANTTLPVAGGVFRFNASHQYLGATPGANYAISVTVQDDDGGSDTVTLTASPASVAPPPGLVDWFTGDGLSPVTSSDPTIAADVTGANPGMLVGGVTYAPGKVGSGFSFDGGTASYVNVPDAPSLNSTTATWDFWVKTTQSGSYVGFVGKHDASVSYNGVTMYMDPTGLPSAQIKANGATLTLTGTTHVNDGQFHHMALTFQSGSTSQLYVDGQQQASGTAPAFSFNPNPLRFGRMLDNFWAPLNGLLDEVQVVNRMLSPGEIQAIANNPGGTPPPGLISWWQAEGTRTVPAPDIAGTNTATLVGDVTRAPGKVGNAFNFNGTDGYVKLPDNFIPFPTSGSRSAPLAFTAWFKTLSGGVIIGQQGGSPFSANPQGWVPGVYVGTDGKLWAQMFWNGAVQQVSSPTPVNDGQFHFVAISSDGTTESVYLDNQLLGTTSGVQVGYTNSYSYQIGVGYTAGDWQSVPGGWYPFKGLIDEVQIFNSAISAAAIQDIYNAGSAGQVKGVSVRDLPPVITGISRSAFTLSEGGALTLNGAFTDPQPGDPHTVIITWGDGSPDTTFPVAATSFTFSASHRYLEEAPPGGYPIRVTVQDIAGGSDTVTLTSSAQATPAPAGLVSWWSGDGNNPTTAPDIAGTNPGTLSGGVTYAPGKVGNAFSFDGGRSSYVSVPDAPSLDVTTGATWDFWFQSSQSGTYVGLVGKHDANTSLNGVTLWIDPSGVASVQIKSNTVTLTLQGNTLVNDGQFHHLALTFVSGGAVGLYVDGQLQASGTAPVFTFNPNPLRFGSLLDGFWTPLRGLLDEVQIYNRVLSASEIQAIFNAGGAGQVKGVTVIDPPVAATSGFTFTAIAGAPAPPQTVATFTDPGGPEALSDYSATIGWGDNASSPAVILFDTSTGVFTVQGSHLYAQAGSNTITVTIHHDAAPDARASGTANVTDLGLGVQPGETAEIGFWRNNGQALILSFNGGSSSTALADWLATTFPHLYGTNAGANNLTGQTNAQVATFYLTQFGLHGPKVEADVLATALSVYATTMSLGSTAGQTYGFTVDAYGLGARSFNVGTDGAAVGVPDDTTLNVYQLLRAVDSMAVNGVLYNGDAVLRQEATDLFDALNQAGGI
jgi:hypothetical protein